MLSVLVPGVRVGDYEVQGLIAIGGTGVVVKARNLSSGTEHALKILHASSPSLRERLLREGRIQTALRHPNLVRVSDVITLPNESEDMALVMDLVSGPTLGAWARRHRPTLTEVDQIAEQLFAGLGFAHGAGVVHRDVKPENVLLERRGDQLLVRLTDFGVAHLLEPEGPRITDQGQGVGTPRYMAPEQYEDSRSVDARADLYALGALLHELLSGVPAFQAGSVVSAFAAASRAEYTPLEQVRPDTPSRMVRTIHAALRPDPGERPASIVAMQASWRAGAQPPPGVWSREAIEAAAEVPMRVQAPAAPTVDLASASWSGRPNVRPRARATAWVTVLGVTALLALGGWMLLRSRPSAPPLPSHAAAGK